MNLTAPRPITGPRRAQLGAEARWAAKFSMKHALIVEDNANSARLLGDHIAACGLTVAVTRTLREARRQIALQQPDIMLLDPRLPDGNGMDLLAAPSFVSHCEVVLVTDHGSLETAIQALRLGAADYLVRPINLPALQRVLSRVTGSTPRKAAGKVLTTGNAESGRFGRLWGRAPAMRRVYEEISRVAGTGVSVFITGESGTGKEVVAQTVHDLSDRRDKPFLAVNCGAISPHLIESEMFGHEKGSFTGADRQHLGYFECASGGTLFLDEIAEMPVNLQVKLLRVLETGHFTRVGASQSRATDVRVIAATNRSPLQAVAAGRLREDLLYRLNVFPISMPPLREHLSDVELLAWHFLDVICCQEGLRKTFSDDALQQLAHYQWPGNVRELRNAVQRAYVMAGGDVIDARWLPGSASAVARVPVPAAPAVARGAAADSIELVLGSSVAQAERVLILATLRHLENHKERTAAVLGISLKTLYNRLREYVADTDRHRA